MIDFYNELSELVRQNPGPTMLVILQLGWSAAKSRLTMSRLHNAVTSYVDCRLHVRAQLRRWKQPDPANFAQLNAKPVDN